MARPVLITAGATRNPIDSMRYISALSTGRTSLAIAGHLEGRDVTVLGSPEALLRAPDGLLTVDFDSTRDLLRKMEAWVRVNAGGAIVHAAAVGDYEVADPNVGKISSMREELLLRLTPTPKIADRIKEWDPTCYLVTFKAAAPDTSPANLIEICHRQRERTSSDLVLGNVIGAFAHTTTLVDAEGATPYTDRAAALKALADRVAVA